MCTRDAIGKNVSGKSGRSRGGRRKIGERYLRPRKDQEDGGGKRAAVVRAQDKKGQTMETEEGRERGRVRSWWHQLPASRDTLHSHRVSLEYQPRFSCLG